MNYFYINTKTMEYPLYEGDVRLVHEDIGDVFELPSDSVFAQVEISPIPDVDPDTQILIFGTPTFSNEKWTQAVLVQDLTESEIALRKEMRKQVLSKPINDYQQGTTNETTTTN